MKYLITLLILIANPVNAAEFSGRLVGTIDGVTIDEPIRCLGTAPPEAFFQGSNAATDDKDALEISGGASGNYLNLVIRGPGIDLRGRFKGFSNKDGKISFSSVKKRKNKKDQQIDISFWCG
ncbi:hypothetical protein [Thiolapillus sp.]